ncbi:Predicted arabinose efflux permease, MFS family [Fontibacillus panacisegetis]|uniref:Predicted arabinose efflux permease, MFS family n=1 Tax=Fontibacillus panacisegetis TaxID=670482 RepID=A0A1G7U8G5_9BACL|nr:MFS transporter [Fontibacillus panacisegetis]SDG43753.1 Predicted arabinose efflux permease, MFS family [Fontibacillus panacisegetis]
MEQKLTYSEKGLWRNRSYVALMGAQLVSNLGDWLYLLALLTMIGLKWNATPWEITITMLSILFPMLIGGPIAGMLADRVERKKLMIISDVARFAIVIGLIFVTALWQVYLILIIKGVFDVLFSPAKNGKLKEIVPSEQMEKAVSYSSIIEQGSKIIGPAIGGMLTAAFGVSICFMIDAATFLVSACILLAVPGKKILSTVKASSVQIEEKTNVEKTGFWSELAAGMKLIVSIPLIAYGTLTLGMALLVLQIADSQTVVLFREIPGMSEDIFGWCITLSGVGTLASVGIIQLLRSWSPLTKMGVGGALLGTVFALAGYASAHLPANGWVFIIIMMLFFLAGLGAGMTFVPFNVMLQQKTPEAMIGRVFGTVTSITSAASVLGPVFGGTLVTAFGPAPAFIISGGLMAVIGLLLLVFRPMIMKRDYRGTEGITVG